MKQATRSDSMPQISPYYSRKQGPSGNRKILKSTLPLQPLIPWSVQNLDISFEAASKTMTADLSRFDCAMGSC